MGSVAESDLLALDFDEDVQALGAGARVLGLASFVGFVALRGGDGGGELSLVVDPVLS